MPITLEQLKERKRLLVADITQKRTAKAKKKFPKVLAYLGKKPLKRYSTKDVYLRNLAKAFGLETSDWSSDCSYGYYIEIPGDKPLA